jgi:low affinity Fe/Cu permease
MHEMFRKLARLVSLWIGSVWALVVVAILVGGTGYYFNFSEDWKFDASLSASILTLVLLIFLQRSQNHSDAATHLKLDELIRSTENARNEVAQAEQQEAKDLEKLKEV